MSSEAGGLVSDTCLKDLYRLNLCAEKAQMCMKSAAKGKKLIDVCLCKLFSLITYFISL